MKRHRGRDLRSAVYSRRVDEWYRGFIANRGPVSELPTILKITRPGRVIAHPALEKELVEGTPCAQSPEGSSISSLGMISEQSDGHSPKIG